VICERTRRKNVDAREGGKKEGTQAEDKNKNQEKVIKKGIWETLLDRTMSAGGP